MKRYIKSAGYYGYSMSNNAVEAYENGEKPLSKWTKSDILTELEENGVSPDIISLAKSLKLSDLKEIFLYKSSWHHTSKMYNRTDFYAVDDQLSMSDIQSYLNQKEPTPVEKMIHLYKFYVDGKSYYGICTNGHTCYIYDNGVVRKISQRLRASDIWPCDDDIPNVQDIYDKLVSSI